MITITIQKASCSIHFVDIVVVVFLLSRHPLQMTPRLHSPLPELPPPLTVCVGWPIGRCRRTGSPPSWWARPPPPGRDWRKGRRWGGGKRCNTFQLKILFCFSRGTIDVIKVIFVSILYTFSLIQYYSAHTHTHTALSAETQWNSTLNNKPFDHLLPCVLVTGGWRGGGASTKRGGAIVCWHEVTG